MRVQLQNNNLEFISCYSYSLDQVNDRSCENVTYKRDSYICIDSL